VDFVAHQAQLVQARLRDNGGFNGDRVTDCALRTLNAANTDWLKSVFEKSDLNESNFSGIRMRETLFAHCQMRRLRLRESRLERVEMYFCDLNEIDAGHTGFRRAKIHACEAMNALFSGAQIAVTRFDETKLARARFDGALVLRTVFADARLGGPSLERADFSAARLIDVAMRGANLMGASFNGATLVGVDLTDAVLDGADFRGATAIGCHFPRGFALES
jgi:uncharacterized protein YjbI with pentapeptide repeats